MSEKPNPLNELVKSIRRTPGRRSPSHLGVAMLRGEEIDDEILNEHLSQENYTQELEEVLRIYFNTDRRVYVEAAILSSDKIDEVSRVIEVPEEVLSLYSHLFFDISHLDKLERLLMLDSIEDEREKSVKLWALSQGLNFIAWRLGKVPKISPVEGLSSLYSDCFFKAKEAFYNGNTEDSSREGLRWSKQATDIARLLKSWVSDHQEAMEDIRLALENVSCEDEGLLSLDQIKKEEQMSLFNESNEDETE